TPTDSNAAPTSHADADLASVFMCEAPSCAPDAGVAPPVSREAAGGRARRTSIGARVPNDLGALGRGRPENPGASSNFWVGICRAR
ncbi:MAG: hypothetical protein PVJ04_16475, partial [Gemmatimonadota bacterium]